VLSIVGAVWGLLAGTRLVRGAAGVLSAAAGVFLFGRRDLATR
jgi:hypothetical protein